MRSAIRHSGAVNGNPRFTFQLIEVALPTITVERNLASLRAEVSEAELRDLIARAQSALEEMRLHGLFDTGALSFDEYSAAVATLDRAGSPTGSKS